MADDINISPDMINNLVNMLKNSSNSNNSNESEPNSEPNFQSNSQSNSINIGDILSKFSSNNDNNSTENNNSSASIDFETIMKIKSIMEALNTKNDPKSNLLYSLKPYLRKSKQAKLDQYVNILKISQVTNLFKNEKGDAK